MLSWRHTEFNVHSRVRAKTRHEAERVGKHMVRPLLSLEPLSFDERTGQVGYRYGKQAKEVERMDYLEFIARVTSHIPDKGWAEMIRKVSEVDPMVCPQCGGQLKVISFLTGRARLILGGIILEIRHSGLPAQFLQIGLNLLGRLPYNVNDLI